MKMLKLLLLIVILSTGTYLLAQDSTQKLVFIINPRIGYGTNDNIEHGKLFSNGGQYNLPRIAYGLDV